MVEVKVVVVVIFVSNPIAGEVEVVLGQVWILTVRNIPATNICSNWI